MRTNRKSKKRLIFAPEPKQGILRFVANLNFRDIPQKAFREKKTHTPTVTYAPFSSELRRMVGLWQASKSNLRTLFESDRELARELHIFRVQLIADHEGTPRLSILTAPQGDGLQTPHTVALALFLDFLLNPEHDSLGGPCKECDKYYWKPTRRRVTFCSPECGTKFTSRKANDDRYQREREDKIAQAKRGLRNWSKTNMEEDWREYVHRTEFISKNLLTRAEARNEFIVPKRTVSAQKRRH